MATVPAVNAWPVRRILLWSCLALLAVGLFGPSFVRLLVPAPNLIIDFFQEWGSARLYRDGYSVYTPLEEALVRYTKIRRSPGWSFNELNAHPPTAVLLALPFGVLDYPTAHLAWNFLSLALLFVSLQLIIRQLEIRFHALDLLWLVPLLLLCTPFMLHLYLGQINLLILALLVGTWSAERSNRPLLAGFLLGTATVIKLFPGLLVLYFVLLRRWRVVLAALGSGLAWTAVTALVLGIGAFQDYVTVVLPHIAGYRSGWLNFAVAGFWSNLFDGNGLGNKSQPLWHAPDLALLASGITDLLILASLLPIVWRARTRDQQDLAFALCLTAMLLVSPITWPHSLLLLLLPMVLWWRALRTEPGILRLEFVICLIVFWINPRHLWNLVMRAPPQEEWFRVTAQPWQVLTGISIPFYALLGFFVLGWVMTWKRIRVS